MVVLSELETAREIESGKRMVLIGPAGEIMHTTPELYRQHPEWYSGARPISAEEYLRIMKVPERVNPSPGILTASVDGETVVKVTYSPPLVKLPEGEKEELKRYGIEVKTLEEVQPTELRVSAPIQEVSRVINAELSKPGTTVSDVASRIESVGSGEIKVETLGRIVTTPAAPTALPALAPIAIIALIALALLRR